MLKKLASYIVKMESGREHRQRKDTAETEVRRRVARNNGRLRNHPYVPIAQPGVEFDPIGSQEPRRVLMASLRMEYVHVSDAEVEASGRSSWGELRAPTATCNFWPAEFGRRNHT